MTKQEALVQAFKLGFDAGFNASGEGFNGEWPFAGGRAKPHHHEQYDEELRKAVEEYEQRNH